MTYITYRNYKGGINNLIIATDSKTGLTATSTKSKEAAIVQLNRKITQHQQAQKITRLTSRKGQTEREKQ